MQRSPSRWLPEGAMRGHLGDVHGTVTFCSGLLKSKPGWPFWCLISGPMFPNMTSKDGWFTCETPWIACCTLFLWPGSPRFSSRDAFERQGCVAKCSQSGRPTSISLERLRCALVGIEVACSLINRPMVGGFSPRAYFLTAIQASKLCVPATVLFLCFPTGWPFKCLCAASSRSKAPRCGSCG